MSRADHLVLHGHEFEPRTGKRDCLVCHRLQEMGRSRSRGVMPRDPERFPCGHPRTEARPSKPSTCGSCHRLRERQRRENNREAANRRNREYAVDHRQEAGARHARWRSANAEHVRAKGRESQRRSTVGRNPEAVEYAAVLRADPCSYCGAAGGTIDHISAKIGETEPNVWWNLTAACVHCNAQKKDRKLVGYLIFRQLAGLTGPTLTYKAGAFLST